MYSEPTDAKGYSINDLRHILGVSRTWILNRETAVPSPERTPGGHRVYSKTALELFRMIAQEEGRHLPIIEAKQAHTEKVGPIRIAVVNQKGGVGKTTLTQNLGIAIASKGYRCLLVDLDRQFNLTTCFGVNIKDDLSRGLGQVLHRMFLGEDGDKLLRQTLSKTEFPNVDLIPNNMRMFEAEGVLRADTNLFKSLTYLDDALFRISQEYDFVFIDCPPDLGILTANGIKAANAVLIPVDHNLSLEGISQLKTTLKQVSQAYGEIPILGVVINKYDARTNAGQYIIERVEKTFPRLVFKTRIPQTTRIMESHITYKPLLSYDPKHPASRQFGRLADEVIDRVREEARRGS